VYLNFCYGCMLTGLGLGALRVEASAWRVEASALA